MSPSAGRSKLRGLALRAAQPTDIGLPAINDCAKPSLARQSLGIPEEALLFFEIARSCDALETWEKRLRGPERVAKRMLFELPPQELVEWTHALVHRKEGSEER